MDLGREYGYLAGITVLAVVVGGAALFLVNPAHTPAPMPDDAGSAHTIVGPAAELYADNP